MDATIGVRCGKPIFVLIGVGGGLGRHGTADARTQLRIAGIVSDRCRLRHGLRLGTVPIGADRLRTVSAWANEVPTTAGRSDGGNMRKRVYIAGPITHGDRDANVKQAVEAARQLIEAGYAPLVPHLHCLIDWCDEVRYEDRLQVEFPWVAVAEAVVRLPGRSEGSDREVELAWHHGIPVYHSVKELLNSDVASGE